MPDYSLSLSAAQIDAALQKAETALQEDSPSLTAAVAQAEAARDAAFVDADVYDDTAAGIAAVADGEQFQVASSDGFEVVRYRRDSSSTQTEVARYPAAEWVREWYVRSQAEAVSKEKGEDFAFFNLASQTVTNISDAATPSYTATKTASGLQIALSTSSRDFVFSTANKIGPNKTRVKYTGVISTGTTGCCGLSIYDGTNRTTIRFQGSNGRLTALGSVTPSGTVVDGIGPLSATMTVEMDFIFDGQNNSAVMFLSLDGGAPYSFSFTGIAVGDIWLSQRNSSTVTHSLDISAVGEFEQDTVSALIPEITTADRNALNAAIGLVGSMRRLEPSGWDYDIPNSYQFYQNNGKYWSNIDLRPILSESDPEVLVMHVDIATGDDANDGSESAPLKSLHVAASRSGAGGKTIIKAKGGLYPYANCFRNFLSGSVIQITSWDGEPIVSSMHDDTLSWALDTGTTYVATQAVGSFSTVFDASDLTSDGDYGALELAADLATCRATPGTWYSTGTSRYVNLHDGRAPDGDLRCYTRLVGGANDIYGINQTVNGQTLYMEDVHLEGGDSPYATRTTSSSQKIYCYAKRCSAKYGANNGTNITSDGIQVWQECIAAWNGDDGFNYKGSSFGGSSCLGVEIDCIGRWNGRDSEGTNNGSTQHGGPMIRVNGVYHDNQDRNVHDIDANVRTLSWNFGVTSRDSQTGDANFAAGILGGSDTTLMWLDGCVSTGGVQDIQVNAGATVYTADFTGDAANTINNSGTITTYTP